MFFFLLINFKLLIYVESGKNSFSMSGYCFFTKTVFKKSNEVKSIVFTINIGKKYDPFFYCFSQKNMSLFLSKIEVFILNTLLLPLSLFRYVSKSFCCHKSNKTKGGGSSLSLTLFYVNDHVIRVVVVDVAVV